MARNVAQSEEEIADRCSPPAQLLTEIFVKRIRDSCVANSRHVHVSPVAAQQNLMGDETIFSIFHLDTEPIPSLKFSPYTLKDGTPNGEAIAADYTHGTRGVLNDLSKLETE